MSLASIPNQIRLENINKRIALRGGPFRSDHNKRNTKRCLDYCKRKQALYKAKSFLFKNFISSVFVSNIEEMEPSVLKQNARYTDTLQF